MAVRRVLDLEAEIVEAFERSGRVTEYLVDVLPKPLWQQEPPSGHGRTIAGMICHIHSVRKTFAKMGGGPAVAALDRKTVTPAGARKALREINGVLENSSSRRSQPARRASKACRGAPSR